MSMKRLIPQAILATMSLLALLALVLSVRSAEKISSFATPAPGDPAIVKIFHTVVQRSLDAGSFTLDNYLNFRAPDRTSTTVVGTSQQLFSERVIGQKVYLELGTDAQGQVQWGSAALTHQADVTYGPQRATQELKMLLGDDSVVRSGDNFIVRQVLPADFISQGNPGQVLVTYTVYVADDYVTGVSPRLQGWISVPTSGRPGHFNFVRVNDYRSPETTYSNYGNVAAITAPPLAQTTPMATCADGGYEVVHNGRHVCSIFG